MTTPTASTRDWLRLHDAQNAKLAAALKAAGITTKAKRREAFNRGATKVSGSVIGAAGRSEKDVLRRLAKKGRAL